jgi:RsiW-degrading membrane proteinase PrsW (M82 family)
MRQGALTGLRQPAFWLFLMLLGISAIGIGAQHLSYVQALPGAWLVSILLMTVIALPAIVLISRLNRFEPEPIPMMVCALLWGGLVAYFFSGVANNAMLGGVQKLLGPRAFTDWAAAIVAPANEEYYKTIGLLVLFLIARREFRGVMDGLVYGAMIGLGFQAVEDVQYFIEAARLAGAGGQISAVVGTFVVRVLIAGLYSHTLFTGLVGAGFAYLVTRLDRPVARRVLVFAGLLLAGWGAHFVWNSPLFSPIAPGDSLLSFVALALLKGVPFLALLVLLTIHARRRGAPEPLGVPRAHG